MGCAIECENKESKHIFPSRARYLVPSIVTADADHLQAYLLDHATFIIESVMQGYLPRARWPWNPIEEKFSDWFTVTSAGAVKDLCADSPSKEPSMEALAGEAGC
jgi:hypothetical protein